MQCSILGRRRSPELLPLLPLLLSLATPFLRLFLECPCRGIFVVFFLSSSPPSLLAQTPFHHESPSPLGSSSVHWRRKRLWLNLLLSRSGILLLLLRLCSGCPRLGIFVTFSLSSSPASLPARTPFHHQGLLPLGSSNVHWRRKRRRFWSNLLLSRSGILRQSVTFHRPLLRRQLFPNQPGDLHPSWRRKICAC